MKPHKHAELILGDMFWDDYDTEYSASSIDELISEANIGEEIVIHQAKMLPTIRIRVIGDNLPQNYEVIGYEQKA